MKMQKNTLLTKEEFWDIASNMNLATDMAVYVKDLEDTLSKERASNQEDYSAHMSTINSQRLLLNAMKNSCDGCDISTGSAPLSPRCPRCIECIRNTYVSVGTPKPDNHHIEA